MSLIMIIGVLAVLSIGLTAFSTNMLRAWDREYQEEEARTLHLIAKGIETYIHQNKGFPVSLSDLTPDYVALSSTGILRNEKGFSRYFAVHPAMTGFQNSVGLTAGELGNARFILISDLSQDAAPVISTPAEFDTWWTTDERLTPNLKLHRENSGPLFFSLSIIPKGNGASFSIHNQQTNSNGGLLPTQAKYHLLGTEIGFDEASTYAFPEVRFALTTNTAHWFDPLCISTRQWNPIDPNCGNTETVRDELNALSYNGNDGTQNWINSWQETGESDGPTNGKMQVVADAHCVLGNCFRFGGGGGGPPTAVSREVDIAGATSVTLTFSYRRSNGGNGGSITVEASSNGGASWTILQAYLMNGSDASQIPQNFDLTAYATSNAQIRFLRSGNVSRMYYVDNVEIAWN